MTQRIYRLLLRLYPVRFRREFSEPMAQLFADQFRDRATTRERLRLLTAVLLDLVSSVTAAHLEEVRHRMKSANLHVLALFAVMMLFLGRFELRTDDTGIVAFFVLLFGFVLAYLRPELWKLWALVGLCVPLAHLAPTSTNILMKRGASSLPVPALLAIAAFVLTLGAIGSFAGTKFRGAMNRPAV